LFIHAERLITAAQDLQQEFRPGHMPNGPMRLGVNDAFAAVCLPQLLRKLSADHPELDVSAVVDNSHALTLALNDGAVDVAVVSTPPVLPGLRYERLGQQEVGWVGGPDGVSATEDAAWILGARIFVTPSPSNLYAITTAWFQAVGLAVPRLSVCSSMAAIVGLVQAGSGIGILPLPLVRAALGAGTLQRLRLPGAIPAQVIFAAYSKGILDGAINDTIRAVRQVVEEQAFCQRSPAAH
jgi:DNA-binding transcriptional LysR family regulator